MKWDERSIVIPTGLSDDEFAVKTGNFRCTCSADAEAIYFDVRKTEETLQSHTLARAKLVDPGESELLAWEQICQAPEYVPLVYRDEVTDETERDVHVSK